MTQIEIKQAAVLQMQADSTFRSSSRALHVLLGLGVAAALALGFGIAAMIARPMRRSVP